MSDEQIAIHDGALIYKRGEHWHVRMWLNKAHQCACFSLKTTNTAAAEDRAKQHDHTLMAQQLSGQAYFAVTTKAGVAMRAKVEHAFRVIKRPFGNVKVRYRGLNKNTAQLRALFALSNLWMARKTLQALDAHLPVTCADLP